MRLRWEKAEGNLDAQMGYSGEIAIGLVLRRSIDGVIIWEATSGVHMKHTAKTNGTAKSFASGRRAVERAWGKWLDRAALQPK